MTFGISCYLAFTPVVDVRMMPTNRICVWVPILLVCVRGMLFPCQFTASVILYTPRFFLCVHIVCSVCLTSIIKGRKNVYVSFYARQHQYVNVRITFRISVCRKEKKRLFLQRSYSCVNHTLNRLKRLRISNGIQFDTNEHNLHRCYWHTLILCSIVSLGIYTPMADVHCVNTLILFRRNVFRMYIHRTLWFFELISICKDNISHSYHSRIFKDIVCHHHSFML